MTVTVCLERIDEAIYHFEADQSELLAQYKPALRKHIGTKRRTHARIFLVAGSPPRAALALQLPAVGEVETNPPASSDETAAAAASTLASAAAALVL